MINVDVAKIYRGMKPEKELMGFACSMSGSIDPRRPWKLTPNQSASVNDLPCIVKLAQRAKKLSGAPEGSQGWKKYRKACRRVENEKKRQRRLLLVDIVDCFKKEQPVKDSERQLSGKVVDEDTRGALERSDQMTPEQLHLIDAILTLPEATFEKECQRRIAAINAVTAYCGVEEGQPCCRGPRGRRAKVLSGIEATDVAQLAPDTPLSRAISSIKKDKRPTICFLCLGNPALPIRERVVTYATPGSLTRHFNRKHVSKLEEWEPSICWMCDVKLEHRQHLQNHAERFHGTVSRRYT